jgi:hypothetical protein
LCKDRKYLNTSIPQNSNIVIQPNEAKDALVWHRVSLDRVILYAFTIVDLLSALTKVFGFGIGEQPIVCGFHDCKTLPFPLSDHGAEIITPSN